MSVIDVVVWKLYHKNNCMKHNYTFNFLIRFLYKECSVLRRFEIENQIEQDEHTRKEYLNLKKAYDKLPMVSFYPSDKAIKNILDYSQSTDLQAAF